MKKLLLLATTAFLVTGVAFAHDGDGKAKKKTKTTKSSKHCGKGCCKDEEKKSTTKL